MTKAKAHGEWLLGLIAALPLACADTVGAGDDRPIDAAPRADATALDAPPATDAADVPDGADAAPPIDQPPLTCAGRPVIDLDLAGGFEAGAVRYRGRTGAPDAAPVETWACGPALHPGVFRVTMPAAGRVRASTDDRATSLAVFDGCPDFSPPELLCVPPLSTRGGPSVSPERAFAAGDTVYVVVGGATSGAPFTLTVAVAQPIARDAPCDPLADAFCAAGTGCSNRQMHGEPHRCVDLGTPGAPCRGGVDAPAACDPGLRCDPFIPGVCLPALDRDAPCEGGSLGRCPAGQSCAGELGSAGATPLRCRDDGAAGRRCRGAAPRCDPGSVCTGFVCQRPLAVGAACDPRRRDEYCGAGAACQGPAGAETCRAEGALDGQCRAAGAPCDPGLACARRDVPGYVPRCRRTVAAGEACDPDGALSVCADDAVCAPDRGAYRCAAEGARLGRCRAGGAACDEGLRCGVTGLCAQVVDDGGACDRAGASSVCADGSGCDLNPHNPPDGPGRCARLGVAGGPCRTGPSPCDPGLACSGRRFASLTPPRCLGARDRGAACDPWETANACVAGTTCGSDGAGGAACTDDGALRGACRRASAPCDEGLACSIVGDGGTPFARACVRALATGAACALAEGAAPCATGSRCLVVGDALRCAVDGAPDGRCRESSPRCDGGLACGADARCRPAVGAGGACDPARVRDACAEPLACIRSLTAPGAACALTAYVERPSPDEAFVDACAGGTRLFGDRALLVTVESARVALPFAFRAYGADVSEVQVSTTGVVSLGPEPHPLPYSGNVATFPWAGASVPLVAAYWDFLGRRPGEAGGVCVRTVGEAPDRRFVIGWSDVFVVSRDASHLTFAVVLHEGTGVIDVRYAELRSDYGSPWITNGSSAGLGIHGRAGLDATVHREYLTAPTAIRYAPR